jgi:hypothetical protein
MGLGDACTPIIDAWGDRGTKGQQATKSLIATRREAKMKYCENAAGQ